MDSHAEWRRKLENEPKIPPAWGHRGRVEVLVAGLASIRALEAERQLGAAEPNFLLAQKRRSLMRVISSGPTTDASL
jgi:hypothetical protein